MWIIKMKRIGDNSANLHASRADIAALLNVSPRTVASAAKVKQEGAPELIVDAVQSGAVSVVPPPWDSPFAMYCAKSC